MTLERELARMGGAWHHAPEMISEFSLRKADDLYYRHSSDGGDKTNRANRPAPSSGARAPHMATRRDRTSPAGEQNTVREPGRPTTRHHRPA